MQEKNKFLSIGNLSKISGVSIKSLRYYDRLNILKPAYIDRDTGYRYYTFGQIHIVGAIQLCVELDIPLNSFLKYLGGDGEIKYARLLEYGVGKVRNKIAKIEARLRSAEEFQKELIRAESHAKSNDGVKIVLPALSYYVFPYEKNNEDYTLKFNKFLLRVVSEGYRLGYEFGVMNFFKGKEVSKYMFAELAGSYPNSVNVLNLEEREYSCKKLLERGIGEVEKYFPTQFSLPNDKIVIETELFTESFNVQDPCWELRCAVLNSEDREQLR